MGSLAGKTVRAPERIIVSDHRDIFIPFEFYSPSESFDTRFVDESAFVMF